MLSVCLVVCVCEVLHGLVTDVANSGKVRVISWLLTSKRTIAAIDYQEGVADLNIEG